MDRKVLNVILSIVNILLLIWIVYGKDEDELADLPDLGFWKKKVPKSLKAEDKARREKAATEAKFDPCDWVQELKKK